MTNRLPTVSDLPAAERQRLRALARAEIENPCGGYDVVSLDGGHPLDHLTQREAAEPFVGELAQRAVNELRRPSGKYGGSAATRRQLAQTFGLAQDAVVMPNNGYRSGSRNFDQDPNDNQSGTIDAMQAQQELQSIFDRLDESERPNMLAVLQQFCDAQGASTAETNEAALDQRPRRPSAADRQAMDAQFARRARNTADFLKRWPQLQNLEIWR